MTPPKRIAFARALPRAAMLLVFGAMVSVAATWVGIACSFGWGWQPQRDSGAKDGLVDSGQVFAWPQEAPPGWTTQATGRLTIRSPWSDHATYLSESGWMHEHRAGLPLRCLVCWETEVYQNDAITRLGTHGSFPAKLDPPKRPFLPYQPLWLGLIVNSVVYAAAGAILVYLCGILRRRLRRKSGHCDTCGYDRAGLAKGAACPECGASDRS